VKVGNLERNDKDLEEITETEFLVRIDNIIEILTNKKRGLDKQIVEFSKLYSNALFYKTQDYNLKYWYNKKNGTIGYSKKKRIVGFRP